MKVLTRIRRFFGPSAAEILNMAIARAARLAGELKNAEHRVGCYSLLVNATDPNEQWWRYADLRQKLQDARDEYMQLNKLSITANEQVVAMIEQANK